MSATEERPIVHQVQAIPEEGDDDDSEEEEESDLKDAESQPGDNGTVLEVKSPIETRDNRDADSAEEDEGVQESGHSMDDMPGLDNMPGLDSVTPELIHRHEERAPVAEDEEGEDEDEEEELEVSDQELEPLEEVHLHRSSLNGSGFLISASGAPDKHRLSAKHLEPSEPNWQEDL